MHNLNSRRREYLPAVPTLEFIEGDICNSALVSEACAGPKSVVCLAALVSVVESVKSPDMPHSPGGIRYSRVDTTLDRSILDFNASTILAQGLRATLNAFHA